MLNRLQNWLIMTIAHGKTVIINADIKEELQLHSFKNGLLANNRGIGQASLKK